MKIMKYASIIALVVGLSSTAFAQQPMAGGQGDQVDRLDQMVNLTDTQKKDLRSMMKDSQSKIVKLKTQAQDVQKKLVASIKPDFDEDDIRDNSSKLGGLTGDITAETALLQARIQKELTAEQRDTLEKKAKERQQKMQQMREKMQQSQSQGGQ